MCDSSPIGKEEATKEEKSEDESDSDEAEEDEELALVHRRLYDFALALGSHLNEGDAEGYWKQANKKWRRLKAACELFIEIQPEVPNHTNFKMAAMSLQKAVSEIGHLLGKDDA